MLQKNKINILLRSLLSQTCSSSCRSKGIKPPEVALKPKLRRALRSSRLVRANQVASKVKRSNSEKLGQRKRMRKDSSSPFPQRRISSVRRVRSSSQRSCWTPRPKQVSGVRRRNRWETRLCPSVRKPRHKLIF